MNHADPSSETTFSCEHLAKIYENKKRLWTLCHYTTFFSLKILIKISLKDRL